LEPIEHLNGKFRQGESHMLKSLIYLVLTLPAFAAAAGRYVNVPINNGLQTQITFDALNKGSTPSFTDPGFSATLISAPAFGPGSFEQNSELCGPHKNEMLLQSVTRTEEKLTEAIRSSLDSVYTSAGLQITGVEFRLPLRLSNTGYQSRFGNAMHTYAFHLDKFDWTTEQHGKMAAIVKSSDGNTRAFGIHIASLEVHLPFWPHVEVKYNNLGDMVSRRSLCKFGVKFWRDESRYGFGSVYAIDTGVKVADIHLPYVLVDDGIQLP